MTMLCSIPQMLQCYIAPPHIFLYLLTHLCPERGRGTRRTQDAGRRVRLAAKDQLALELATSH